MMMLNKNILTYSSYSPLVAIISLSLLFPPFFIYSSGGIVISEIMFNPTGSDTGREWIEIYNSGEEEVLVTNLRFRESGTNHTLKLIEGNETLSAGEYAIIVDNVEGFKNDFPGFQGTIFDSTFSLSNEGESLAITDSKGTVLFEKFYSKSDDDEGNTLNLIDGSYILRAPSPGFVENTEKQNSDISSTTTNTTIQTRIGASKILPAYSTPKTSKSILIDGSDTVIKGSRVEYNIKSKNISDQVKWNYFGNNEFFGKSINVHFPVKGTFIIKAEQKDSEGIYKDIMKVKVIDPVFKISSESSEDGEYIIIENTTKADIPYKTGFFRYQGSEYPLSKEGVFLSGEAILFQISVGAQKNNKAFLVIDGQVYESKINTSSKDKEKDSQENEGSVVQKNTTRKKVSKNDLVKKSSIDIPMNQDELAKRAKELVLMHEEGRLFLKEEEESKRKDLEEHFPATSSAAAVGFFEIKDILSTIVIAIMGGLGGASIMNWSMRKKQNETVSKEAMQYEIYEKDQ